MPHGTNSGEIATGADPRVGISDLLAVFCVHHAPGYSLHGSKEEADAAIDYGEGAGECYGVATYHIPTKTLHMRDPLDASDANKVRASIEEWLKDNQ